MACSKKHLNSKQCPFIGFAEMLRQALSIMEKILPLARNFPPQTHTFSQCESCPEKETCPDLAKRIEELLPPVNTGRSRRENLTEFYPDTLEETDKKIRMDIFTEYEACLHLLTKKQRDFIFLYYHKDMTYEQISQHMNIKRNAVSGLKKRAKDCKEKHDAKLRRERADYLKKINTI